jgi:hypothetical protein
MQDFLSQMGLERGVKLSRPEWAAVRGALGRPRRLSQPFLRQERVRLEAHRAAVRAKYEEVRTTLRRTGQVPCARSLQQALRPPPQEGSLFQFRISCKR